MPEGFPLGNSIITQIKYKVNGLDNMEYIIIIVLLIYLITLTIKDR